MVRLVCWVRLVFVGLILGVAANQDFGTSRPKMTPDLEKMVIQEGDELKIECDAGGQKVEFSWPKIESGLSIHIPNVTSGPNNTTSILVHNPAYRYHTGWYACAESGVEIDNYEENLERNSTEIRWIYVYVNSSYAFSDDNLGLAWGVEGHPLVVACHPTSPESKVICKLPETSAGNLRAEFVPKFGCVLHGHTIADSGVEIKCVIEEPVEAEVTFTATVWPGISAPVPKPIITVIEDELIDLTWGDDLHLNCTVVHNAPYSIRWLYPSKDTERRVVVSSSGIQLVVKNVTALDEGKYTCLINDGEEEASRYVKIHDPHLTFITLNPQNGLSEFVVTEGKNVQWFIEVKAFPRASFVWFDPDDKQINDKIYQRFLIDNSNPSELFFKIFDVRAHDNGIYRLTAMNNATEKNLTISLHVHGKPNVFLTNVAKYYKPNTVAKLECKVTASPRPDNITWTFARFPNFPYNTDTSIESLENHTSLIVGEYKVISQLNTMITGFGQLTCMSCNTIDCATDTAEILVYDGDGPFSIDHQGPVAIGDTATLKCIISNSNFSNTFQWMDQENELLSNGSYDGRILVTGEETEFSYASILNIANVVESDAGSYECAAASRYGGLERREVNLTVEPPLKPYFNRTTLNSTKIEMIALHDKKLPWPLECNATGMPIPTVRWYKDDKLITNDDVHEIFRQFRLNIKKLTPGALNRYSCVASNRVGSTMAWIDVEVKEYVDNQTLWLSIVGSLIVIVVVVITFLLVKVRRERILRKDLLEAGLTHFQDGALECLNPDLTIDDQAELLPYDKKWEFPRERLKLGKQLGSGAFGVVVKAEARGISNDEETTIVAVKMVRRTAEPNYIRALASELKIMVHLGKHLNVVNLVGACTKNIAKRELFIIVEYCRFGNLHNYLLRHRSDYVDQIDPQSGKIDRSIGIDRVSKSAATRMSNGLKYAALSFSRSISTSSGGDGSRGGCELVDYRNGAESVSVSMQPDGCVLSNNSVQPGWRSNYRGDYKDQNLDPICTQDLICWAWQVARGMEYLSARKVLHGDLAARNILLADDNVVKICDFGLAKSVYKDANYKKQSEGLVPIKWMAIESIRDKVFSTQSDVWSFGIVLWEFFTLAQTPYPGMDSNQQYTALVEGYRLEQPDYAPNEMYQIMLNCWKGKPSLRPSFRDLVEGIGNFMEDNVKLFYVDLNTPYVDSNHLALEEGHNDYLTMMSAPNHDSLSSPNHEDSNLPSPSTNADYLVMSPVNKNSSEGGIFSPRVESDGNRFNFSSAATNSPVQSDSDEAVESAPMLTDEDAYLKPIDVHQRRAEFTKQRQSQPVTPQSERTPDYYNTMNIILSKPVVADEKDVTDNVRKPTKPERNDKKKSGMIISTPENYVNMPQQKSDQFNEKLNSHTNPSYVMMSKQSKE